MHGCKASTAGRATEGLLPFAGTVQDMVMIDRTQAELFTSLGRTRGPFQGVASWPSLEEALARTSCDLLETEGKDQWSAAGGIRGPDGKPTCLLTSPLAARVVQGIAANPGGLLWTDSENMVWAVRLVPVGSRPADSYFGFAICWKGNGTLLDPRGKKAQPLGSRLAAARQDLGRQADGLRLAARAQQMLMAIHLAVASQRRSVVLLPDVLLGQVVWGGDRAAWPQDWRGDLFSTIRSLTDLRSEILRLSSEGWRPQLGAHSVAVAHVEKLWVTRPQEDFCRPCCPMWGGSTRHCHFAVQAGYGFLGVMEKFATGEEGACRVYDFKSWPKDETGEELNEAKKSGRLIQVSAPTALFGPSRWSGLSEANDRVIQALVGELTRPVPPRKSPRCDKAQLFTGKHVPGRTVKQKVACPLLPASTPHVAFCGNGHRHGMGYLIAGDAGGGWLRKCGYPVPEDGPGLVRVIHQFLTDLSEVQKVLGLTVVGLEPRAMRWFDLTELRALAGARQSLPQLLAVHLRVYGPEDYQRRCREHFAKKGKFSLIPGGEGEEAVQPVSVGDLDLATRIRLAGIKQTELARHLGVTQPFVNQLLNNNRPWPCEVRKRAETFVRERQASAAGEVA